MKNIEVKIKGNKLLIEIDLEAEATPSKSGKTMVFASTKGNVVVGEFDGGDIWLGLNAYYKPEGRS